MNPDFERLMSLATQQTRGGDLRAATASIQRALAGQPDVAEADAEGADDVIDVEARVIEDPSIEDARADRPPRTSPAAEPSTHGERFVDGRFARGSASIDYKLYVPPGDTSAARPLLLMLHGCTQDPDDFALGTRMNDLARRHGWLVLYPEQSRTANPQGCWNWFKHNHQERGRGEPALLSALTRHVMTTHGADSRQVHVAGLSAGGAMAVILGQAYPELFASVGVHSGLPFATVQNAQQALMVMRSGPDLPTAPLGRERSLKPVPTIVFHGTRDMTVNALNGQRVYAEATVGRDGTHQSEHGHEGGRAYTRQTCVGADGRSLAELWLIEGAGHAWSGGDRHGSHTDWQGPDAAAQMICFFEAHPQPASR